MSRRCRAILRCASASAVLLAGCVQPGRADPLPADATRVVELFTSQSCPKCPPADELVAELAREPRTIALSFSVSYWDYVGWHDTLAAPEFGERQHAYATVRGDKRIFTPQAIVDGRAVEPGADRAAILRDMSDLEASGQALEVPLDLSETDGRLHIAVGAAANGSANPATMSATVMVMRVARTKTVQIERGANSGRSVTYVNAVRALHGIGAWTGQPESFDMLELKADDEAYVVLLQAGTPDRPGLILAAAQTGAP